MNTLHTLATIAIPNLPQLISAILGAIAGWFAQSFLGQKPPTTPGTPPCSN